MCVSLFLCINNLPIERKREALPEDIIVAARRSCSFILEFIILKLQSD